MSGRGRMQREQGRYSLVDDISFQMPVSSRNTPALMAVFPINARKAARLLPGNEVHPFRLWNKGLLVVTVVDYRETVIGKYIEFSVAIACTHGRRPAPRVLPVIVQRLFGLEPCVVAVPDRREDTVKRRQ